MAKVDVVENELNDGNSFVTFQIRNFYSYMKTWNPAREIHTKPFQVQDVSLCLKVYPNGRTDALKGNVSVYLVNDTNKQVFGNFKFKIGALEEIDMLNSQIGPKQELGIDEFCSHVSKYTFYRSYKDLEITCKIRKLTTDRVVWEMYHENKEKFAENNDKIVEVMNNLNETKEKLSLLGRKFEDFKSNNNNLKRPRCPICLEEMTSNTKIAQCISGHHLCWSCKGKMVKNECPSCGQPVWQILWHGELLEVSLWF